MSLSNKNTAVRHAVTFNWKAILGQYNYTNNKAWRKELKVKFVFPDTLWNVKV